tara:strand:- start:1490 stop:1855 length:366 start_codon:yes stop_codon:yes gene_type:complete
MPKIDKIEEWATMQTTFKAEFWQSIDGIEKPQGKLTFEIVLLHIDKPENELWDDAISCAWIQLKDHPMAKLNWELREVLAFTSDNNALCQHSVKVNSNPRGAFDAWRDLTYLERFNQALKG